MTTAKESRLGGLAPKYGFIVNPYPDVRVTKCPRCEGVTGQRKVPLLIHVDPDRLIALNYTCRYCPRCDVLVAHKHEVERLLRDMFSRVEPQAIGNSYLIVGTVEKEAWRKGMEQPKTIAEILPHTHDFKQYYGEVRATQGGWFPRDVKPPIRVPPKSEEWTKAR